MGNWAESMKFRTGMFRIIAVALVGTLATGCASVKVSVPGMGNTAEVEDTGFTQRVALHDAAEALSDHPWGESPETGMVSILFGTVTDNEKERTVKDYIAAIQHRGEDPVTGVFADADMSLAYARQVVEAGRQTIDAISPRPGDIAVLETAIGDARECRSMYVAALETLDRRDSGVTREEITVIRDAFTQTIDDMSLTADLVANKVAMTQDRARFAERAAAKPSGLSEGGE